MLINGQECTFTHHTKNKLKNKSDAFKAFIRSAEFPCVGAKSASVRDQIAVHEFRDISATDEDHCLYSALTSYISKLERNCPTVQSFAAIFSNITLMNERTFERYLWKRLQCLHDIDAQNGEGWDNRTTSDPASPHFSFSIAGESFFVIGLHPNASRPARRFSHPTLVFNSTEQFSRLREDGRSGVMQKVIRIRDAALAGSINPMLDDYGRSSEARQYSGRKVQDNWTAPFHLAS